MTVRLQYSFPVPMRLQLEAIIQQCADENGGHLVGEPSIKQNGKVLEVDEHPWWLQHMKVAHRQLTLLGVNEFANRERL